MTAMCFIPNGGSPEEEEALIKQYTDFRDEIAEKTDLLSLAYNSEDFNEVKKILKQLSDCICPVGTDFEALYTQNTPVVNQHLHHLDELSFRAYLKLRNGDFSEPILIDFLHQMVDSFTHELEIMAFKVTLLRLSQSEDCKCRHISAQCARQLDDVIRVIELNNLL